MNLVRRNLQGKAGWIFLLGTTNEEDHPHLENESRTFKDIPLESDKSNRAFLCQNLSIT